MARIFCIANQKGGVGKTTTTVNLAAGLARIGQRVLVVDLDPQGNATMGSGIDKRGLELTVYDVLLESASVAEAKQYSSKAGYDVLGANRELAGAEVELVELERRDKRLKGALSAVAGDYDFILIDCPPSLSILTINGLYAADEVFVPVNPGFFDLIGLAKLQTTVKRVRTRLKRPELDIRHVIVNNFSANKANSRDTYRDVREAFGDRVIDTAQPDPNKTWYGSGVPNDGKITSSQSAGVPISLYDKRSRATAAYRVIATVLLQRGTARNET